MVSLQGIIALAALIGATVLAVFGMVDGTEALTLYGVVLGYAFGVTQGRAAERAENSR